MNDKRIYLDHSATTPLDPAVLEAMTPYFSEVFGNAGSLHSFGLEAKQALKAAREFVAFYVGCKPEEIVFTAGGSESDNLAIRGIVSSMNHVARSMLPATGYKLQAPKPHIVTTAIEHKAVLDTVKSLEKAGEIEATYIKPHADGVIRVEDIKAAIRDNTILVSVMHVNNEVGTIQPIREIGKMLKVEGGKRNVEGKGKIYFHTDAVQAIEFCQIAPEYLGVDLLSAAGHKVYGPKGVGFLYVKRGTPLLPEITGGGQEWGLRASTENLPGIVGLAKALELIIHRRADSRVIKSNEKHNLPKDIFIDETALRLSTLRDKLIDGLLSKIPDAILNGKRENLAPHIANISFVNAEGEAILLNLDFLGIAVSTGSACTSRTLEPSHVLSAMGVPPEKAHGSVRFSLGHETTEAEIDRVIEVMPGIIAKLRAMSPL